MIICRDSANLQLLSQTYDSSLFYIRGVSNKNQYSKAEHESSILSFVELHYKVIALLVKHANII